MAFGREQIMVAIRQNITDPLKRQNTAPRLRAVLELIVGNFYNVADDVFNSKFVNYITSFTVGNLPANTNLNDVSVIDMLKQMTTAPYAVATAFINNINPVEKGAANAITISGGFNLNDEPTDTLVNRILEKAGSIWQNISAESFSFPDTISATTTYNLKANSSKGLVSASRTVSAFAPSYYGNSDDATLTEADAKAGTKQIWGAQSARSIVFNNSNQRVFFSEPQTNGIRNRIMDQNGFNVTAGFTRIDQTFTLADGSTEAMYTYLKNEPSGNGAAFTFTFFNN